MNSGPAHKIKDIERWTSESPYPEQLVTGGIEVQLITICVRNHSSRGQFGCAIHNAAGNDESLARLASPNACHFFRLQGREIDGVQETATPRDIGQTGDRALNIYGCSISASHRAIESSASGGNIKVDSADRFECEGINDLDDSTPARCQYEVLQMLRP
jgi:hypothetical protein